MSNPWSVLPGGVSFSRPGDEEDEDWGFGTQGDPVPEAPDADPTEGDFEGEVSTDVDTDRPDPEVAKPSDVYADDVMVDEGAPVEPDTSTSPSDDEDDEDEDEAAGPAPGSPFAPLVPISRTPTLPVRPLPVVPPTTPTDAPAETPIETPAETEGEGVPARNGLRRLPSGPRGPRPTWAQPQPVEVPAADAAGEGVDIDTTPDTPTATPAATPAATPVVPVVPVTPLPTKPLPVVPVKVLPTRPQATTPATPTPVPVEVSVEEEGLVDLSTGELLDTPAEPSPLPVDLVEQLITTEDEWGDEEDGDAEDEEANKKNKGDKKTSRAKRPVAVTDRDIAMLQYLGRYRMATYPQLAGAFDTSYGALRHRMPRLAREGLVIRRTVGKSAFGVWLPTDAGMKLAGLDLPTPTLSWATVAHTLGLVDIGTRFEVAGETVVTEREIRAADTRGRPSDRMQTAMDVVGVSNDINSDEESPRLYVVDLGSKESAYAHIPDMVLVRPAGADGSAKSVAIELELNHKPAAQWRKILKAYNKAPHIGLIIYYTHQRKVATGIAGLAKELGMEAKVKVRKFEPSEDSAVPLPKK